jgi:hypothetical protein
VLFLLVMYLIAAVRNNILGKNMGGNGNLTFLILFNYCYKFLYRHKYA